MTYSHHFCLIGIVIVQHVSLIFGSNSKVHKSSISRSFHVELRCFFLVIWLYCVTAMGPKWEVQSLHLSFLQNTFVEYKNGMPNNPLQLPNYKARNTKCITLLQHFLQITHPTSSHPTRPSPQKNFAPLLFHRLPGGEALMKSVVHHRGMGSAAKSKAGITLKQLAIGPWSVFSCLFPKWAPTNYNKGLWLHFKGVLNSNDPFRRP